MLATVATASADLVVGAADDAGSFSADGGREFYGRMAEAGLSENRISVVWSPGDSASETASALRDSVVLAESVSIRVTLAVYPLRARTLADSGEAREEFVRFIGRLARELPGVSDFIVGNEPNQPRFWQPQFDPSGSACTAYAGLLAKAYDELKGVDPRLRVIGGALAPRGNDDPLRRLSALSPVRCIRDLGRAYRASGRKRPLMDEFDFHPLPLSARHSPTVGYQWPNAGLPNLDRIRQAIWDAFAGTGQPTFAEPGLPVVAKPLQLRLSEVGWQVGVVPGLEGAYSGRETVLTTDEQTQAAIYASLVPSLACDRTIKSLLFFPFIDERRLEGWQSGLVRADGSLRPAFGRVQAAVRSAPSCRRPRPWRHTEGVAGAAATFLRSRRGALSVAINAGEAAGFRVGVLKAPRSPLTRAVKVSLARSLLRGGRTGELLPHRRTIVRLQPIRLRPGAYVVVLRATARMNPRRTQLFVSRRFRVAVKR
jgi:hypothetical protein